MLDASTSDAVARVSTTGLDTRAMVDHARRVGGPALRRLTFQQRAAALKELATYLDANKAAYHELSLATGATRRDGTGDIDGGIGTVFAFASRARRELPDGLLLTDGDVEPIGKEGTFVGRHVYTSLRGVVLQVNAFNFPVWGMLEKLAPAVLAGVPTIVKPATQTAYLTAAVMRDIIASGALPEGAVQFICGSAGDLLDHLGGEDVIAFTGSASTAAVLRGNDAVTARAARFNAETDSLNCSILGPDSVVGTPEFDLYIKEISREITTKAGQRCTCIRRALVPESMVDDVIAGLRARLDKVVVGNPRNETVTMGALVSLHQRDEVRDAVASPWARGRDRAWRSAVGRARGRRSRSEARSWRRWCCWPPAIATNHTRSRRSARSPRSSPTPLEPTSEPSRRAAGAAWSDRSSRMTRTSSARW